MKVFPEIRHGARRIIPRPGITYVRHPRILAQRLAALRRDEQGQTATEAMLIIAGIVLVLAASLSGVLPRLANGFMGIARDIAGPIP